MQAGHGLVLRLPFHKQQGLVNSKTQSSKSRHLTQLVNELSFRSLIIRKNLNLILSLIPQKTRGLTLKKKNGTLFTFPTRYEALII
jgi:hypothetical protein